MATPEVVVVGHVVQDLLPSGWRLGGSATFAAVQAQRLGLEVGVVTRVSRDVALEQWLPGIALAGRPSTQTTAFENVYEAGRRRQRVPRQAEPVEAEDVPEAWRAAPMVLEGPVCGEVPAGLDALFPHSLLAVAAQGWLRRLDRQRQVRRSAWGGAPFWANSRVLFVSDEDLGRRRDQLDRWTEEVPVVVLTQYRRGTRVYLDGRWRHIQALPTREVDPTGAGDVFAVSFLVRYQETEDAAESAKFASAAAACSVEAPGIEGIAARSQIEARMEEHPEIVLR